ncbi:MAG: PPOX class F420-dependent oxidoreductase [Actinomycetota bacterium]|nr:PPOX class F420-dependent oxidoreductase [Actinomycetota bacterium]
MDDRVRAFLDKNHTAVQTTLRRDGTPHVAMIGVGLVDGRLWSSATQTRVRTKHLRRDPRSSLCVFDTSNRQSWIGLDCRVTILDGPEAVDQNLALYRVLAGEPDDVDEYRQAMVREQRIIFEFEVLKAYGQY